MTLIPFKVSARAARLIGRENVSTAQGAITELVKNAYDADATACAILFLQHYSELPKSVSERDFNVLSKHFPVGVSPYTKDKDENIHRLKDQQSDAEREAGVTALSQVVDLWIVDNGQGMSPTTVETRWMVIGTDAKEVEGQSTGGRTVTGAKGIGRFALDRLGAEANLYTAQSPSTPTVHWEVDWDEFEGDHKVLEDVNASLDVEQRTLTEVYADLGLHKLLPTASPQVAHLTFDKGTAICISRCHDLWDVRDGVKLRETLESLLPPRDQGDFDIFIYDHRSLANGWIDTSLPDQFDYRLVADVDAAGEVEITIDRQEIDPARVRKSFYSLALSTEPRFRLEDLARGSVSYTRTIGSLMRRDEKDDVHDLLAIGPFSLTLYFFKLASPSQAVLQRYPQRTFDASKRRAWLANSGGVRIYRDHFRVRPYGEPNSQAADWLLLGQRSAGNPAGVARIGWRVSPQQMAGTINISKRRNPLLADQSNREGFSNERVFSLFRSIVLALVEEFERDRSKLYAAFEQAYDIDFPKAKALESGSAAAARILRGEGEEKPASDGDLFTPPVASTGSGDSRTVAEAFTISQTENKELRDENRVLRGMATLGTVLVSFTHELRQIKANMGSREGRMRASLDQTVDRERLSKLHPAMDPYDVLARWGREDQKVSRWIQFALSSVSPAKRRRTVIDLTSYATGIKEYWDEFLKDRHAVLTVTASEVAMSVLAHEIDLDSIFFNLIVNSIEAFTQKHSPPKREIAITLTRNGRVARCLYEDTGPGLSTMFGNPDDIFEFGRSSKVDSTGAGVGTGIGMWLLKSIVDDYGGSTHVLSKVGEANFAIQFELPLREATSG